MIKRLYKFYIESSTGTLLGITFLIIIVVLQLKFGTAIIDVLPTYIEQQDLEIQDRWESQAKFGICSLYYVVLSAIGFVIISLLYMRKIKYLLPALLLCVLAIPLGINLFVK